MDEHETGESSESLGTVVVAGAANLAIALAKLVAGLISSSASMLSEAAHSAADTVTEVLLFTAIRHGERPADRRHPLGHGRASYLWAIIAACFTLVVGAGFSLTHGWHTITHGEELGNLTVSYIVLVVSFAIESVSLWRGLSQLRAEAGRQRISARRLLSRTADTMLKAVVLEDIAALAGIVIAGVGLALSQVTGSATWDGVGSIAIGLLLLGVALTLIRTNASLLIGQAASSGLEEEIRAVLVAQPEVEGVVDLVTVVMGPNQIMVAAKVDFLDETTGERLELASDRVERCLTDRFPAIKQVFLDPTPGRSPAKEA
ncbi:cation diffusion facilitator family transporter [Planotetraspora kaengkrachanensis]|uniref:Cation diffusion facilitator transporter n=1 Tax=Planotetraspora kaengkrachanensis TaxID=575193 RepID=A0A8J3PQ11_9ACTN|nr:cation diffusion facilitator family transporter [Planotetraspora kaengkrachanensis]GIG76909.1 cation diffusion facilitator transporter [Planotetraspora kaengkrachanensis]